MSLAPFDLTGGPFLTLYGVLLVATIVAGFIIPRWLRPEGRTARVTDSDQLAFLAGGAMRFADTVVARLLASRALGLAGGKNFYSMDRNAGRTAAERSVLTLPAPIGWPAIASALKSYAEPVESRLVADGLVMDRGLTWQMRFWQTLPYLLLLIFGAIKWEIGTLRDRPVGYLTALLVVTALFAIIRLAAVDRRTRGGLEALTQARARSERLRRAPTANETDLAVALFGTAVLVGSGWSEFHQMRTTSSGDSGSSGGDGGSGCGGGGCGGCGG